MAGRFDTAYLRTMKIAMAPKKNISRWPAGLPCSPVNDVPVCSEPNRSASEHLRAA
jgi:hypothetical protein